MLKVAPIVVGSWILSPTAECKNYSVANNSRLIADNDGSVLENIIRTSDSGSSDYGLPTDKWLIFRMSQDWQSWTEENKNRKSAKRI